MNYIRVKWIHTNPDEPVWLFSEIDDDRWEIRKVEIFRGGRIGFASKMEAVGGTFLGEVPVPPLGEIAADPQFMPSEISADEFEGIWASRYGRVIDKSKFESRGGYGCSNSDYVLHRTTCCNSFCVEDDELLDLYIDPNNLSRTIQLVQGCTCPFCGSKEWGTTEITAFEDVPEAWRWACRTEKPKKSQGGAGG